MHRLQFYIHGAGCRSTFQISKKSWYFDHRILYSSKKQKSGWALRTSFTYLVRYRIHRLAWWDIEQGKPWISYIKQNGVQVSTELMFTYYRFGLRNVFVSSLKEIFTDILFCWSAWMWSTENSDTRKKTLVVKFEILPRQEFLGPSKKNDRSSLPANSETSCLKNKLFLIGLEFLSSVYSTSRLSGRFE
jgi:hypothetical protein